MKAIENTKNKDDKPLSWSQALFEHKKIIFSFWISVNNGQNMIIGKLQKMEFADTDNGMERLNESLSNKR